MPIQGKLTLDEAKRVAVQGEDAPIGLVVLALDTLYLEVRRHENLNAQSILNDKRHVAAVEARAESLSRQIKNIEEDRDDTVKAVREELAELKAVYKRECEGNNTGALAFKLAAAQSANEALRKALEAAEAVVKAADIHNRAMRNRCLKDTLAAYHAFHRQSPPPESGKMVEVAVGEFQPESGKPCGYCVCGHAAADHFFDAPNACNFGHPCRCPKFEEPM